MDDRSFGAHAGKSLHVEIADASHPITRDLSDWDMLDETYTMAEPAADDNVLLTVKHSQSMEAIAWNREHKNSRVFCFQSGHDNQTWADAGFQEVLRRGIFVVWQKALGAVGRAFISEALTHLNLKKSNSFGVHTPSLRTCLNNRWQSYFWSFVESFSCFHCWLLHTCRISIAVAIRFLDPLWGF